MITRLRFLKKRWHGMMAVDIAVSPWMIFFSSVGFLLLVFVGYFGVSGLYFSEVSIQGARYAAISPNVSDVQNRVYDAMTKVLPANAAGQSLFTTSDIQVNQFDGPYVTTKIQYRVLLPGVNFWTKIGISPAQMIVPLNATYSFYREF